MAGGGVDGFDDDGSGGTRDFMFGFAMGAFLGVISEYTCCSFAASSVFVCLCMTASRYPRSRLVSSLLERVLVRNSACLCLSLSLYPDTYVGCLLFGLCPSLFAPIRCSLHSYGVIFRRERLAYFVSLFPRSFSS